MAPSPTPDPVFEHCVRALGSDASVGDLRGAAEKLRFEPHRLRDRLRHIAGDPDLLERVADQSYWHENGFAKIRLAASRHAHVRLHVWGAGDHHRGDVDPHGHRWEFGSWVVAGAGVQEAYFTDVTGDHAHGRGTADDMEYSRYAYSRDAEGGHLRPVGPAWLRRAEHLRTHRAGTVYACPENVLHTVAPIGSGLVATLVVQGPERSRVTPVYRADDRPIGGLVCHLEPGALADIVRAVADAVVQG